MSISRLFLGAMGFAGGVVVVVLLVVLISRAGDPIELVDPVSLAGGTSELPPGTNGITAAGGSDVGPDGSAQDGSGQTQVLALEEVTGVLGGDDDLDDYEVDGIDLGVGPEGWVRTATAPADYDGDGRTGTMGEELDGLVGTEVTLLVQMDEDRDQGDVYVVQGLDFRDVAGGPSPWLVHQAAVEGNLRAAALDAVGEGSVVTEMDLEDDGSWELEVTGGDGMDYEVRLSPEGQVLRVELD